MKNTNVRKLVMAAMMLALAIAFQFVRVQLITGVGVNVALAVCAIECGWLWGAGIGLLTPILALIIGVHPAALIPVIPVIMLGNAAFSAAVGFIAGKIENRKESKLDLKRVIGIVTIPVILKFLVIFFGIEISISLFGVTLAAPLRAALGILQIPTAFAGALITVAVMKAIEKVRSSKAL